MRDILSYIVLVAIAFVLILGLISSIIPLLEDIKVVEPTEGIQCAIVGRVAIVSIDCWEKDTSPSLTYNGNTNNGYAVDADGERVHIVNGVEVN